MKLEYLNIGGNFNISNLSIQNLLKKYNNFSLLHTLELSGLSIDDTTISLITSKCNNVTTIGIGYADISENAFSDFINKIGSKLIKLNISWLSQVSVPLNYQINGNVIVDLLSSKCPQLRDVDVSGNKTMTVNNLLQLIEIKIQQVKTL